MHGHFNVDDLPDGYTVADIPQLDKEWDQLVLLWDHFSGNITDTAEGNIHHPPVLFGITGNMFEALMARQGNNVHFPDDESYMNFAIEMVAFGGMMFRFGQHCANQGFLAINMSQCKCANITDDALAEFIGESK